MFTFPTQTLLLAQTDTNPLTPEAYSEISSLTLFVAIMGIIAVVVLGIIVTIRRSQRRKADEPKSPPTEHVDAWAESGKRFDTSITEINPEDDD